MSGAGSPAARRAGVTGHPIHHSKSPLLHRAAYRLLDFDCSYDAIDIEPEVLKTFMAGFRADHGWCGLSVTMPHKAAMLGYMDVVTDTVSALGVLNTVTVGKSPDGKRKLTGHNTDVAGIVGALAHAGVSTPKTVVILGGGGTASAAVAAAQQFGAERIEVYVRSVPRAASLQRTADRLGANISLSPFGGAVRGIAAADVVISTLPPFGGDALATDLEATDAEVEAAATDLEARATRQDGGPGALMGKVLLDVAYEPWPSALATAWERRGGSTVPGLEMLLYQAIEQVRLFSGIEFQNEKAVTNVMCDAVGAPRR